MRIDDELRERKRVVEEELGRLLGGRDSRLYQAMRHAVLDGGKRFRPLLLLSAGTALGAGLPPLLPFACGLELIHCYSLVHDDLPAMDDDDIRRGRPSCHKAFGEGLAILAGDALLTLAFEAMAAAPLAPPYSERRASVIEEIGRRAGGEGMIDGQARDILYCGEALNEAALLEIAEKKTGGLIIAAVKAGAMLAGASAAQLAALAEYGRNVGAAFQLRDDLQDASPAPSSQGRPNPRPSLTALFGEAESRLRLRRHVERAIEALDGLPLRSEALARLAGRLL
ncbi:MAG: hypothetical protein A2Y86_03225, partial [Candidatus Aminicenantes bacterium RBG_13_62_12]